MPNAPHPFNATIAKINAFSPYFQLSAGAPLDGDWSRADTLLSDSNWLPITIGRLHAKRGYITPRDLAINFYNGYQWYIGAAAIGAFLADARVPDVGVDNIALKFDTEGWVAGIALFSTRFFCLPDDPSAAHPDAIVTPDRDALRQQAARSIYEHVALLIPPLTEAAGVSEHALQLASANSQTELAVWILQHAKQTALAEIEAHAFAAALPFPARARLFQVECDGERALYVNGSVCCHWYLDPENATKSYCDNCPKMPLPKRIEALRKHMREARCEKVAEVG